MAYHSGGPINQREFQEHIVMFKRVKNKPGKVDPDYKGTAPRVAPAPREAAGS